MAKVIYRYVIKPTNQAENEVTMPKGAEILSCQFKRDELCLWAIVDGDEKLIEVRHLLILGTGHVGLDKYKNVKHLGTVQVPTFVETYIWHIFEIIEK